MGTHPIFESDFDCLTEMDAVIKRLSADDQHTLSETRNQARRLNNVLCQNPFLPVTQNERVVHERDGLFYAKIEQRSATDRRFEFYVPALINHLDRSDPVKTRSIIMDHVQLAFDDRCPEPFILARLIDFLIENETGDNDGTDIAQLIGTTLETCANRKGNLMATARTVSDVLKWSPESFDDQDPILLRLVNDNRVASLKCLLRTMLRILSHDIGAMKEKIKRVQTGADDSLIKVDERHIPAAYHLFHRVNGRNSSHDQIDKWARLFSQKSSTDSELIGIVACAYFDAKEVVELLHLHVFKSVPIDYFANLSTSPAALSLLRKIGFSSPLAAAALGHKLLNELFVAQYDKKVTSLSTLFEFFMFKTPSEELLDLTTSLASPSSTRKRKKSQNKFHRVSRVKQLRLELVSNEMRALDRHEQLALVNARDDDGRTPLYHAVVGEYNDIVTELLSFGARPDIDTVFEAAHRHTDSLAILAPFVDVGLLIEKDYADKCALDYVEEKDLLNILTLCLFGKMADSTDLNERNKRNRKVKLEPPQAMVMVASINALLTFLIERTMKTKRALEAAQPAESSLSVDDFNLIENFTDIRDDLAFLDRFVTNILTSQMWRDYAKTLIVGNAEYDTFIKLEFGLFQARLDISTCI